jgi:hypothetical protein
MHSYKTRKLVVVIIGDDRVTLLPEEEGQRGGGRK